jgi:predicted nucleotidyltransferase
VSIHQIAERRATRGARRSRPWHDRGNDAVRRGVLLQEEPMSTTDLDFVQIPVPVERIEAFCRRWHVAEFALFGSVLTDEFRPDSDVDVLVTFEDGFRPKLGDWLDMEDELASAFGRRIDLVEKARLTENPFIRKHILATYRVLYAA